MKRPRKIAPFVETTRPVSVREPRAMKVVRVKLPGVRLSEKQFQSQVVEFARLHGWLVYHTYDSRRSTPGFPDLVMIRDIVLLVAELKVGTNTPTAEQHRWLSAYSRAGALAYVWRPENWSDIESILGGLS